MFGVGMSEMLVLMAIVAVLFGPALAVAWLAWTLARSAPPSAALPSENALEASDPAIVVARERYARGEITKDEFEEIRATLGY